MKKSKTRSGIILLLIVALLAIPLAAVQAQDEGITETFDDTSLNGWERSEQAIVKDGTLVISPGNFAAKFGEYASNSYEFKARFAGPGIMFFRFYMREGGDYAVIFFDDRVVLEKTQQDTPTELAAYEQAVNLSDWSTIKVINNEGKIIVSVNAETILQASEPGLVTGGGLGFWVEGESAAEFDDLTVSETVASAPEGQGEAAEVSQAAPTAEAVSSSAPVSVQELLSSLSSSQANPLELTTFVVNLALSVLLSFILSRVYVHWGSSLSNRRRFAANFVLITVTTTFIILVVRSSVALSLGLVGALSIVRFRAAIKEPEELAYLFFAISIGIGLGDNQRLITVLALVVAIATTGILYFFRGRKADFNLHVTVTSHQPEKVELESIMAVLSKYCSQYKLMRFDDTEKGLESSFLVEFRTLDKMNRARSALRGLSSSLEITFLDNKGIW